MIEKDGISYGSGTLIDSRGQFGLVVTNWHVIRDAAGQITVEFPDGFKSPAQVAKSDKDWDLAALSIYRPNATPVPVTATAPQKGEPLTIAGYGSGDYRLASGNCTQYLAPGVEFPRELVELATEARQGDSGGPIFNQQGQLSGVLLGSGPGYTTGSYGGRVLQFLATVVPGGVPGSDGAPPTAAIASNGSNAGHDLGLILGPPPQATALHQPVAPAPSPPPGPWKPPANQLPSDIAALTPAAPVLPGNLLAPPSRDALSQRFDDVPLAASDVDPKAAVNLDRLAANSPIGDNTLTPRDDDENLATSGNLLHVPLTPRAGTSVEAATDINSAPPDQLLAAAWKRIGGPSVLDQTKTVLAGIGVLSVLLLFWRMSRRSDREMDAD